MFSEPTRHGAHPRRRPASRADSSDARHRAGTGLGISITRALMEKMNGIIDFETRLGVGTTFYVIFPGAYTETVVPEPQA